MAENAQPFWRGKAAAAALRVAQQRRLSWRVLRSWRAAAAARAQRRLTAESALEKHRRRLLTWAVRAREPCVFTCPLWHPHIHRAQPIKAYVFAPGMTTMLTSLKQINFALMSCATYFTSSQHHVTCPHTAMLITPMGGIALDHTMSGVLL